MDTPMTDIWTLLASVWENVATNLITFFFDLARQILAALVT